MNQFRSQFGEDKWLASHWQFCGLPNDGFFVEFGSGDGEHFSNTYWLQHARGWRGLLIEADPRNKGEREGCLFERAAIGPAGEAWFGMHPTDAYLSGLARKTPESVAVSVVPLSDVLRKHNIERVDLISIDTEGTELEAWRTLDLSTWRPRIAIVELYTWQLPDTSREIIAALDSDGYDLVHRTECNGIFRARK